MNVSGQFQFPGQFFAAFTIFSFGLLVIVMGGYSFRRAETTVNPAKPEQASQLVTSGVYTMSRNPMYIGFLMWLIAYVMFSGYAINLLVFPIYVVLVNRLYIIPEEKALEKIFGNEFKEYKKRVRRWI